MRRLVAWAAVSDVPTPDVFGGEVLRHIAEKRSDANRRASASAWRLLAMTLEQMGAEPAHAAFSERGKPYFPGGGLYFSLSHSGGICAVSVSDTPTGVDVERADRQLSPALIAALPSPREADAGFSGDIRLWSRKECAAKLTGEGMGARPSRIDTLDPAYAFAEFEVQGPDRARYCLTAAFAGGAGETELFLFSLPE